MINIFSSIKNWHRLESVQGVVVAPALYLLLTFSFYGEDVVRQSWEISLLSVSLIVVSSLGFYFYHLHWTSGWLGAVTRSHSRAALGQTSVVCVSLLALSMAVPQHSMPDRFLMAYALLLFLSLMISRPLTASFLGPWVFESHDRYSALIIGNDTAQVNRVATWVESKSNYGLRAIGWVSDKRTSEVEKQALLPILGKTEDLEELLLRHKTDLVIVADFIKLQVEFAWLRQVCDRHGVSITFSADLGTSMLGGSLISYRDKGLTLAKLRDERLESFYKRVLKRALDVAIAIPVVMLLLPAVTVIVMILHRLYSPGDLFVKQQRVGLYGKRFGASAFRTRSTDEVDAGKVITGGLWLERLGLNSLPLFVNVLFGTMSVVGPRTQVMSYENNPGHKMTPGAKSLIKPGITGLLSIDESEEGARNEAAFRAKSDLLYLENWSLWRDVRIIWKSLFRHKSIRKNTA